MATIEWGTGITVIIHNSLHVVSCTESNQVSIVSWSWNWNRSGASDISMAQLVRKFLKHVRLVVVVIMKHMVVRWSWGTLDSSVWAEIEIILTWMTNVCVNNGTSWDIVALSNHILSIFTEKSHVMALLDTDESDSWLIGAIFFPIQGKHHA